MVGGAADGVRSAESQCDLVLRREREAKRQLSNATDRTTELERALAEAEGRKRDCISKTDALRDRDAYKAGDTLEQLRQEAARQRQACERTADEVRDREDDVENAATSRDRVRAKLDIATGNEASAHSDIDASASTVGARALVAQAAASAPDEGQSLLDAWTSGREEQVRAVRDAIRALKDRVGVRNRWEEQVDGDQAALDDADRDLRAAKESATAAWNAYRDDVDAWLGSCAVLDLEEPDLDDPEAVTRSAIERASTLKASMAVEKATIDSKLTSVRTAHDGLLREREEVANGRTLAPDAPAWRSSRERRGAPLWRLDPRLRSSNRKWLLKT